MRDPINKFSLLIVGAGRLGHRVGSQFQGAVTAETLTSKSHGLLRSLGMIPRLRSSEGAFDHILFAIPPSNSSINYHDEVARALLLWNQKGSFVFISSTAVYAEEMGGLVTENSALGISARAMNLIESERLVLAKKGTVLRLAGLYDETSGPHTYYAGLLTSELRGDGIINLIHYQDAATLSLKLFEKNYPEGIFIGCDNSPISRNSLVALGDKSLYPSSCQFLGSEGSLGKKVNNSHTRQTLQWSPVFQSFSDFRKKTGGCFVKETS